MNFPKRCLVTEEIFEHQRYVAMLTACLLNLLIAVQPGLAKSAKFATFTSPQKSTLDTPARTSSIAARVNDVVVYNQKTAKFHALGCMAASLCTVNCVNLHRELAYQLSTIP